MCDVAATGPVPDVTIPSPLEELDDDRLSRAGVRLFLKRDDLIHPEITGNKWRKLKYNIPAARALGHDMLLTFGGAYSNHVMATAAAGYYYGFSTIGVIRGEEHLPLNPSLAYAVRRGMRLTYMDRCTYRRKHTRGVIEALHEQFGDFYLLPEGGTNELAVHGCAEIPAEISTDFDIICCAVGTGGTLAGVAAGLRAGQRAVGFVALKGGQFLADEVRELQQRTFGYELDNWSVEYGFHFGGFAKSSPVLRDFVRDFEMRHGYRLDRVYVAKMMCGIFGLLQNGVLERGSIIVALVTGPG